MNNKSKKQYLGAAVLTRHALTIFLVFGMVQLNAQQKVGVGLRFMPTISSIKLNSPSGGVVKGEAVLGFGFGGLVGFNFTDNVGIQGEVIYSSIAQRYKEANTSREVKLNYLNIPILLSLNTGRYKKINYNLVLGPQMGINLGSNITTKGEDSAQAVLVVRKGDLGFAYGAGADFALNPKHSFRLGIGFRGVYGLIDISNNTNTINQNSFYIIDKTNVQSYSLYTGISFLF